jgi:hypothetical protein
VSRLRVSARLFLSGTLLALAVPLCFSQRTRIVPQLHTGQTFFYHIDFSSSRNVKTESRVASPQLPAAASVSASGLLQVEIAEVTAAGFRLKTYYSERQSTSSSPQSVAAPTADKSVEVFVAANGSASQIKGFDQLSPAQQFAWNDWLGRFTSSLAFPKGGVTAGRKWEAAEPETAPSPIAGLTWTKKYHYVRDEPCGLYDQSANANPKNSTSSSQLCAIVLVRATLHQKSSPKSATPEDYKLRDLKTRGIATGQNETILYISRSTGLLIRSTEDAQQFMDAIVALTDGTNQVHYSLNAKSHSQIFLVPDSQQESR